MGHRSLCKGNRLFSGGAGCPCSMQRQNGALERNGMNIDWNEWIGRDGQIRTADPSHPKRVLYQAEPRPDGLPAQDEPDWGIPLVYTIQGI